MAASVKVVTVDNSSIDGEWKVVQPRRGKQRRCFPKPECQEEKQEWVPTEVETDPERQSKLMQKMEMCLRKVENSQFYTNVMDQMDSPEILKQFLRVLGTDSNMEMVIYGIGSIESYETPRVQLSIAILMKRRFDWIGEIQVFDPVLCATESRVLETLGCVVLGLNEQGRREAVKPTLFFMPHCEARLYDNLLRANWRFDLLSKMALFGNSFRVYVENALLHKNSIADFTKHMEALTVFTHEFEINTEGFFAAFHDSSWHFFTPAPESQLPLLPNGPLNLKP